MAFDIEVGNFFQIILPDCDMRFQLSPNRLYYFDAAYQENNVLLLNRVTENMKDVTQREYEGARETRRAMHLLGLPSDRDMSTMVRSNMLSNCPVNLQDVKNLKLFLVPMLP